MRSHGVTVLVFLGVFMAMGSRCHRFFPEHDMACTLHLDYPKKLMYLPETFGAKIHCEWQADASCKMKADEVNTLEKN